MDARQEAIASADAYLNNVDLPNYTSLLAILGDALKLVDAYRRVSLGDGDITANNIRAAIAKAEGE